MTNEQLIIKLELLRERALSDSRVAEETRRCTPDEQVRMREIRLDVEATIHEACARLRRRRR